MTKKKYTFTLTDINTKNINATYDIQISNDTKETKNSRKNTTKLSDLDTGGVETKKMISFLDESKNIHSCDVSMIDFTSNMNVNFLRYNCFWCRNPFETQPLGCPVKYIPSQAVKSYKSRINSDNVYTIKEDVTPSRREQLSDNKDLTIEEREYYETDGVFCSFNCIQAWINDNKNKVLYNQSASLLRKLYRSLFNVKIPNIPSAPHWRVLEQHGGHMNIIQFRDSFSNIEYETHGVINSLPNFLPMGQLFEKKIRF